MKNFFKLITICFIIMTVHSCNVSQLKEDMVQFDQVFLPALYYTHSGDLESAKKAMFPLRQKWQTLETKYNQSHKKSIDWQESIRLVSLWLEEADCAIKDSDTLQALSKLDHARYELIDLRWKENIDYYLDYVWDVETTIDIVLQTSADPMIKLMEWNEFVALSNDVVDAFQKLEQQEFDNEFFKLSKKELNQLQTNKYHLHQAILTYMDTVNLADGCLIPVAAKQMMKKYLNFIHVLGDFEAARTDYAHLN